MVLESTDGTVTFDNIHSSFLKLVRWEGEVGNSPAVFSSGNSEAFYKPDFSGSAKRIELPSSVYLLADIQDLDGLEIVNAGYAQGLVMIHNPNEPDGKSIDFSKFFGARVQFDYPEAGHYEFTGSFAAGGWLGMHLQQGQEGRLVVDMTSAQFDQVFDHPWWVQKTGISLVDCTLIITAEQADGRMINGTEGALVRITGLSEFPEPNLDSIEVQIEYAEMDVARLDSNTNNLTLTDNSGMIFYSENASEKLYQSTNEEFFEYQIDLRGINTISENTDYFC